MHTIKGCMICLILLGLTTQASRATTNNLIGGSYSSWPTTWHALNGANDADDGLNPENDIVGNAANPAGFWASDTKFVYFRMQVASDTYSAAAFQDAHFVMIDIRGAQLNPTTQTLNLTADDGLPDYAFAWDSKSNDNSKHGLEMTVRKNWSAGTLWNGINFDDRDGDAGKKLAVDINGNSRSGDGYLRVIDNVSTVNFGLTAYIDYAVSWNYLSSYTQLTSSQLNSGLWRVALGSVHASTDHSNLIEVSGNVLMSSPAGSGMSVIPEPSTAAMVFATGLALIARRRAQAQRRLRIAWAQHS